MLRIAIQILVRDNRKYLVDYFFPYFSELERKLKKDIRFSYFFLENDSCDESHKVCIKFLRGRSGLVKTSSTAKGVHIKSASLSPEAAAKMHLLADLRTQLNDLVPHDDFDYVFQTDSDIMFESPVVEQLLEILETDSSIGQATANGVIRENIWKGLYYDTWACEFLNGGTPHGHSRSIDTYPKGCVSKLIKSVYGFMLPTNHPCLVKVNSAFGGASMFRAELLKNFEYSAAGSFQFVNVGKVRNRTATCEHKSLCRHVREKGYDVVIDPASLVTWTREPVGTARKYAFYKENRVARPVQVVGKI